MTRQGWVAIYRQIQDHWLWGDKPFSRGQAWIDMLLLANHDDNKFLLGNELVVVEQGSFITSELKLMDRWGWGKSKTRAFLDLLQTNKMIVKKTDRKKTTITIVNYSDYAVLKTAKKPRADRKQTTSEPRADTNNNDNNENKYIYTDIPELDKTLVEFVEHRKKIKKPMSDMAVEKMIKKLNSMTTSIDEQIEILNQSIVNGWQGIFPLKKEKQANNDYAGYDLKKYDAMIQEKAKQKSEYDSFMDQLANMREEN